MLNEPMEQIDAISISNSDDGGEGGREKSVGEGVGEGESPTLRAERVK